MGIYYTTSSTFVYVEIFLNKKVKKKQLSNGFILHPDYSKIFNMANKAVHNLSPLDFVYNVSLPELFFPILHLASTHPSGFGLNTNSSDLIMCLEWQVFNIVRMILKNLLYKDPYACEPI